MMLLKLETLGKDLLNLFFPRLCPACGAAALPDSLEFCLQCEVNLPYTNYHLLDENPFTVRFWGRLPIEHGTAMMAFSKGGRTQRLLHAIKYKNRKDLALYLGQSYGRALLQAPAYEKTDLILPVPLHPRRFRERGYNQSAFFAQGLSAAMGVPWAEKYLSREAYTLTQTQKSRIERFSNVDGAFSLQYAGELAGKQILLVDDVLTTGATLEACGSMIVEVPGVKLCLATLAIANS